MCMATVEAVSRPVLENETQDMDATQEDLYGKNSFSDSAIVTCGIGSYPKFGILFGL